MWGDCKELAMFHIWVWVTMLLNTTGIQYSDFGGFIKDLTQFPNLRRVQQWTTSSTVVSNKQAGLVANTFATLSTFQGCQPSIGRPFCVLFTPVKCMPLGSWCSFPSCSFICLSTPRPTQPWLLQTVFLIVRVPYIVWEWNKGLMGHAFHQFTSSHRDLSFFPVHPNDSQYVFHFLYLISDLVSVL